MTLGQDIDHSRPAPRGSDRGLGSQRAALDHAGHLRQLGLGDRQRLGALARSLLREGRVAAHDEPLAREIGARDLGQILFVEQAELEIGLL